MKLVPKKIPPAKQFKPLIARFALDFLCLADAVDFTLPLATMEVSFLSSSLMQHQNNCFLNGRSPSLAFLLRRWRLRFRSEYCTKIQGKIEAKNVESRSPKIIRTLVPVTSILVFSMQSVFKRSKTRSR